MRFLIHVFGLAIVALLSGCLTRDVSNQHRGVVGREMPTLREYYGFEYYMLTSVFLNSSTPVWLLQSKEYCERYYGFIPSDGIQRSADGKVYVRMPAGTMLRVEGVKSHALIDAGTQTVAFGTMIHPASKEKVKWAFMLSPYGGNFDEAPWEQSKEPNLQEPTRRSGP